MNNLKLFVGILIGAAVIIGAWVTVSISQDHCAAYSLSHQDTVVRGTCIKTYHTDPIQFVMKWLGR